VNLTKIQNVRIGPGQFENPVPGGKGRIYIDDICLTQSTTAGAGEVTGL